MGHAPIYVVRFSTCIVVVVVGALEIKKQKNITTKRMRCIEQALPDLLVAANMYYTGRYTMYIYIVCTSKELLPCTVYKYRGDCQ